jgi:hypothetical protein
MPLRPAETSSRHWLDLEMTVCGRCVSKCLGNSRTFFASRLRETLDRSGRHVSEISEPYAEKACLSEKAQTYSAKTALWKGPIRGGHAMFRTLSLSLLLACSCGLANAQQVPPPDIPVDDGGISGTLTNFSGGPGPEILRICSQYQKGAYLPSQPCVLFTWNRATPAPHASLETLTFS